MNIRTLTLAVAFLTATISLFAQENEKNEKIKYSNVTEFGFSTARPKGVSLEATTAHGVSINKAHHFFGLGFGIGLCYRQEGFIKDVNIFSDGSYGYSSTNPKVYMPIFLNYRYYFKPEKTFSPHLNLSAGGIMLREGYGIYSSITMGFRAGKFSFSSGLSLMPMYREEIMIKYYESVNTWGKPISMPYSVTEWKWSYPFGLTLKVGFAF